MTIHQLKDRCWVLDPSPYDDDDDYGIPHYGSESEAAKALAEMRGERRDEPEELALLEGVQPRQDTGPCWVAECDSDGCDERYEDEEDGGSHFETEASLREFMASDGWTTRTPDLAFCWNDSDEGERSEPPPPSPAEQEAAGQLRLDGAA